MFTASPRPLTPMQRRFVEEYLIDLNATQAAIRAGYSAKTADRIGPELLGKTGVSLAITAAQAERAARSKINAQWVLDRLKAEAENAGDGASHSARVRALELIGKHLGMFVDKIAPVNPDGQTPYLDRLGLFRERYAAIHPGTDDLPQPAHSALANPSPTSVSGTGVS